MSANPHLEKSSDLVARLLENDRHKNEFLATLAHELRNPLAPIMYALESMSLMKLDEDVEGLRKMMARQVDQMVHLIDDLLDISRISCGRIEIHKEVVPLRSIIDSAVEASSMFITENDQILTVNNLPIEAYVCADPSRLIQIVSNLLNNASKYSSPQGHIDLTTSAENGSIVIRVRDNGIGIASEKLDDIFNLFTQVGHSVERGTAGLGIGLTLVKTLVELHDGTVIAESEGADRGSLFTVRLPSVEKSEQIVQTDSNTIAPALSHSFRILIVDDQRALRLVMKSLLEKLGHVVGIAESGDQAIEKLESFTPEIIFSDISMPGMSGYELVRLLRNRTDMKNVYIVAMTGSGQSIDRKLALESGFNEHLTKPVSIQRLRTLFANRKHAI